MEYRGVHSALCTPFTPGGASVDHEALAKLVEDQIQHGIHGLVACGSTGEFAALSGAERRAVVETVVRTVRGRVPVTVGVGAMTTAEAVSLARHAREVGADAVMLVGPYYEPLREEELVAHFEAVALDGGLPVMIYNNPAGTGYSMSPQLIARLASIPGVVALKDTTSEIRRLYEIQALCGKRLQLLNGQDTLQFLGFVLGTRASVWGAANATPYHCALLYDLVVVKNDVAGARRLWEKLYPINYLFETEGYVAAVKAGAALRGVPVGDPRPPIKPLGEEPRARLRELMAALDRAFPVERGGPVAQSR